MPDSNRASQVFGSQLTEAKRRSKRSISDVTCHLDHHSAPSPALHLGISDSAPTPHPHIHHVSRLVLTNPSFCLLLQGASRVPDPNGHEECSFFHHSGQLGKAWAPTLGIWGVGIGSAALFVRLHILGSFPITMRSFLITPRLGPGSYSSFP